MEFSWYFNLIRKRWLLIMFCTVATGVVVLATFEGKSEPSFKQYRAATLVYVSNTSKISFQPRRTDVNSDTGTEDRIYMESLKAACLPVAEKTTQELDIDVSPTALIDRMSFSYSFNENILEISFVGSNSRNAKQIVDQFTKDFVSYFEEQYHVKNQKYVEQLKEKIAEKQKEVSSYPKDSASYRNSLSVFENLNNSVQQINLEDATNSKPYSVIRYSAIEDVTGPTIPINKWLFSLPMGFLLGFGLSIILEYSNGGLKTPIELENSLGVASLASLRRLRLKETDDRETFDLDINNQQAFEMLRARFETFVENDGLKTIMVSSIKKEKLLNHIVSKLVLMLAESGKRVLVISTDDDSDSIGRFFGIEEKTTGLYDVLESQLTIDQSISKANGASVQFLFSGSANEDIRAIYSTEYDRLMAQAKSHFDVVMLVNSSITESSIFLPFAQKADGVIVLVSLESTKLKTADYGAKMLASINTPLLGFLDITT